MSGEQQQQQSTVQQIVLQSPDADVGSLLARAQAQQPGGQMIVLQLPPGADINHYLGQLTGASFVAGDGTHAGGPQTSSTNNADPAQNTTTAPCDEDEEPLYVNAKQYNRILKRREARARLERSGRLPKERARYLHESRHRHALNRKRTTAGRFGAGGTSAGATGSVTSVERRVAVGRRTSVDEKGAKGEATIDARQLTRQVANVVSCMDVDSGCNPTSHGQATAS